MENVWNTDYFEKELTTMFDRMKDIGKDPEGGYTRFIYTEDWLKGMNEIKALMEDAGLTTKKDSVGNLFGKLNAKDGNVKETIMSGSHADTVKNGGLYDGLFGVLAAITAAKFLNKNFGAPKKNIEILAVSEEEGGRFPLSFWGSKNIVGNMAEEDIKDLADINGVKMLDIMKEYGFKCKDKNDKIRDDIEKFLEIHIEQGGVLEKEGKSVGIVEAIVGLRRFMVEIEGEANHAGTTPMTMRKDAMKTAAFIISKLIDTADSYGAPLVLTVGNIKAYPGFSNVVPGKVVFTIDTRTPDGEFLKKFHKEVVELVTEEAKKRNTPATVTMWTEEAPTDLNKESIEVFENICKEDNISYKRMFSGAGHDSQILAKSFDTAMLFVPSIGGISHSPKEFTDIKDLARGAYVLAKAIYKFAY